jgi:hypothetical protein
MHGRSPVAAVVLALVCSAGLAPTAAAQTRMSTVDQAAASVDFGVFVPGRTFGTSVRDVFLPDHSGFHGCLAKEETVVVSYTRRRPHRSMWLTQTGKPCSAAHPDGFKIRRVRVLGRRVTIRRFCAGTRYQCFHERRHNSVLNAVLWLRSPAGRTRIQFQASGLSVRQTVRALRGLRLVDPSRPVVQLTEFLSPDQAIFCQIQDSQGQHYTWCVMHEPVRSGMVGADGSVDVCNMDPNGCIPGGGGGVPLLRPGQTSRVGGFACTEAALAIMCTVAKGEHKGVGFRIAADAATVVSPTPPG